MLTVKTELLLSAIDSARQLKSDQLTLCKGRHGLIVATSSEAGKFIKLLSNEGQGKIPKAIIVGRDDLAKALYRLKEIQLDITDSLLVLKSKRSVLKLAITEADNVESLIELWEKPSKGVTIPALSKLLLDNRSVFSIKDHVSENSVPVHIRWGDAGIAAGMADNFHGVSVRTSNPLKDIKGKKEIFLFSSWFRLLIDSLSDKKSKLHIDEKHISVSNPSQLLVLQAVAPGADVITLDNIETLASTKPKSFVKVNMEELNNSLSRSTAVLPVTSSVFFALSEDGSYLKLTGKNDSGSKITESIKVKMSKTPTSKLHFSSTLYNLLDITSGAIKECRLFVEGKALLLDYSFESSSKEVYEVRLFSAFTAV